MGITSGPAPVNFLSSRDPDLGAYLLSVHACTAAVDVVELLVAAVRA